MDWLETLRPVVETIFSVIALPVLVYFLIINIHRYVINIVRPITTQVKTTPFRSNCRTHNH